MLGAGEVSYEEFVDGCWKLQGEAGETAVERSPIHEGWFNQLAGRQIGSQMELAKWSYAKYCGVNHTHLFISKPFLSGQGPFVL